MKISGQAQLKKNQKTKKIRSGFTIIEVLLFVAIAAMMLGGAIAGSGIAISRQRYNDSVQDFAEFMRRTYSATLSVQNYRKDPIYDNNLCNIRDESAAKTVKIGNLLEVSGKNLQTGLPGRTNCAFYGKLITFGEQDKDTIYVYDIVGRIKNPDVNNPKDTISALIGRQTDGKIESELAIAPEVLGVFPDKAGATCEVRPVDGHKYDLQWGAYLEKPDGSQFKGSIAIIRSPETNQLQTFFSDEILQIIDQKLPDKPNCSEFRYRNYERVSLTQLFIDNKFAEPESGVNFCINSHDAIAVGSQRRNLRLAYRTSNPSAVELLPQDNEANVCLRK